MPRKRAGSHLLTPWHGRCSDPATMQKHVYSAPDAAPARDPLILLVADDAKTRDLVEAGLRRHGYAVCVASTASEAFGRVLDGEDGRAPCVDLVIADLRRDHAGTLELVAALRGIAAKATVLLMIELFSREHRDVAGVFGVEALDEPFALESLRPTVRAIFDRRGQAVGAVTAPDSQADGDDEPPTEREVCPSGARVLVADDDDAMRLLVAPGIHARRRLTRARGVMSRDFPGTAPSASCKKA